MQVRAEDLAFVARFVEELCGVVLDDSKAYLVESRLGRLAQDHGCSSYRELCERARRSGDPALRTQIIDAITTHETLFFRDQAPFDALQFRVLPDLIDARTRAKAPRRLRFWSAACSTGQEPYSIAITLCETLPDRNAWNLFIVATDISDAAIQKASRGWYAPYEIQRGMKPALLAKYFVPKNGGYQVRDELRAMVAFRRRNLLEPFDDLGLFDVIFCRNVAIYFDPAKRRDMFLRLARQLVPDGVLFVGSAESLLDLGPRFAPHNHCRATFYRPNMPLGSGVARTAATPLAAIQPALPRR